MTYARVIILDFLQNRFAKMKIGVHGPCFINLETLEWFILFFAAISVMSFPAFFVLTMGHVQIYFFFVKMELFFVFFKCKGISKEKKNLKI